MLLVVKKVKVAIQKLVAECVDQPYWHPTINFRKHAFVFPSLLVRVSIRAQQDDARPPGFGGSHESRQIEGNWSIIFRFCFEITLVHNHVRSLEITFGRPAKAHGPVAKVERETLGGNIQWVRHVDWNSIGSLSLHSMVSLERGLFAKEN